MQPLLLFIRRNFFWVAIVVTILLFALAFEAGRWSVYQANPMLAQQQQTAAILSRVSKLIQLPTGDTPSIAIINNAVSAKADQPFLINAKNGDVLIVYPNAGEALLYRPSTNKLVSVGPVDNSAPSTAQIATPASEPIASSTEDATDTKSKK